MAALNPFLLAANVPDPDERLLPLLRSNPELASAQDSHGYSLLHAAVSYNHIELLRILVNEIKVDVNLLDEDNETCLFVAETVELARCLVEELHINTSITNEEGVTAAEKFAAEAEYPEIVAFLQGLDINGTFSQPNGSVHEEGTTATSTHPPPLPPNITLNLSAGAEQQDEAGEPDPEFRRRIEELAARDNFNSEEGQQELRALITDAVRGVSSEEREVRQRTG